MFGQAPVLPYLFIDKMINNLRDLGGIAAADGKKIRKGKLIRCARLVRADEKDIQLIRDMGVRYIYDLRLPSEAAKNPDPVIEGAEHISWPFQDEDDIGGANSFKELRAKLAVAKDDRERIRLIPDMRDFYVMMYTDDKSRTRLKDLAVRMMANTDGACLFHCTSGKDRTGMLAALVMKYLGVSREDILKDYMDSHDFAKLESQGFYDNVIGQGGSEEFAAAMYNMYMLHEDNMRIFLSGLDRNWDFFGLPADELARYRANILE